MKHILIFGVLIALTTSPLCRSSAAAPAERDPPRRGPGGFGRPINLGPDDKQAFPDPPAGFNAPREGAPRGRLEMIAYESKSVGATRKMQVYTPPGYSQDKKYPVLYLLHGIGGDETEWQRFATPNVLLDNLLADGKATPMIVVMPNGRAQKNDRAEGDVFRSAPAFAAFEEDLLKDVIPAIESFSRRSSRRATAHRLRRVARRTITSETSIPTTFPPRALLAASASATPGPEPISSTRCPSRTSSRSSAAAFTPAC